MLFMVALGGWEWDESSCEINGHRGIGRLIAERQLMTWTSRALRLYVWQYFLTLSIGCLVTAALAPAVPLIVLYDLIWQAPAPKNTVPTFQLFGFLSLLIPACIMGGASWIAWRERKSAGVVAGRLWLIAASVLNGAACLALALVCRDLKIAAIFLAAGCMGLIVVKAFSRPSTVLPGSRRE